MQQPTVKINQIIKETADTFTLMLENDPAISSYKPGQFINLFCEIGGKEISRSYSFSSSPFLNETPALTIKRMPGGLMSNYLAENLKEGDLIRVGAPSGRFVINHDKDNKRHFLMIAGGSGITPLFSILKSVLHNEPHSRVTLFYANRHIDRIIFQDQLNILETSYTGRLEVIHILEANEGLNNNDGKIIPGRMSTAILREFLEKSWRETGSLEVFVCGPDGLVDLSVTSLLQLGVDQTKIRTEYFQSEKKQFAVTMPENSESAQIKIRNFNGQTLHFEAPKNRSILFSAFDQNYKLPHSCKEAMCGTCKAKLVSGKVEMRENYSLTDEELNNSYVLLCSGVPKSEKVVLAYD